MSIRNDKTKVAIGWHYDSCGILHEDVKNSEECLRDIQTILGKINQVAPIRALASRIFRTYWTLPTPKHNYNSLQSVYRQVFIKDSVLFEDCFDCTMALDMKRDGWELHHQSGPMEITQLQTQLREFKIEEGHPKTFLFLEATITNTETVEYSVDGMNAFLKKSLTLCKAHSDQFKATMGGVL